jgi:LacI family transcriptional regulator
VTANDGHRSGPVTLQDVARRAGVTPAVVSRLINDSPTLSIRPETRARVLSAIDELGYRVNAAARSLARAKSDAFGLIIPDFANPVYAKIIEDAESAAAALGCVLLSGSAEGSGLSPEQYTAKLGHGRVDGLLLAGGEGPGGFAQPSSTGVVPYLLLNRRVLGINRYIVLDDERAAALAVDHLTSLGHRQIAHLAGSAGTDTAQRRQAGYRQAMRSAELTIPEHYVVDADYTAHGGMVAMEDLLALPNPPTAVFVANVASAIGALRATNSRGIDVPEQISIVAMHDIPLASFLNPPLTTVRMPLAEFVARGLQLLAETDAGTAINEVFEAPMQLILRASTAGPRSEKQVTHRVNARRR